MAEDESVASSGALSDPIATRWTRITESFRTLLRKEQLHLWFAQALLGAPPRLAPMEVGRGETLEDNLRRVFSALSRNEQIGFRAAITRVIDAAEGSGKFWPPATKSPARALRDIFRLARLSRHYGILPWIGAELVRLMTEPKSMDDLEALGDVIALLGHASEWIPAPHDAGPDHRSVLASLHGLSQKLGSRPSLSFLDPALLLPAVRYDKDTWAAQVCAAVERYDIRREDVFPDTWPTFGGAACPEGIGLYDLRYCILEVVRELDIAEFCSGITWLASSVTRRDRGSRTSQKLLAILCEEAILEQLTGIFHVHARTSADVFVKFIEFARVVCLGQRYLVGVQMNAFRNVTEAMCNEWFARHWKASADMLGIAYEAATTASMYPVAVIEGMIRIMRRGDMPTRPQAAPKEPEAGSRNFSEFLKEGVAGEIAAWSGRGETDA